MLGVASGGAFTNYISTPNLGTGAEWHFFCARFTLPGIVKLYGDGANNATLDTAQPTVPNVTTGGMWIARDAANAGRVIGDFSNIGIWRRFLTDQEMEAVRLWPMR